MTYEQVLQIVRDFFNKNFLSGNPKIPPHQHNGVDNLKLAIGNVTGNIVNSVTAGTNTTVSPTTGNVVVNASNQISPFIDGAFFTIQTYTPGAAGTATLDLSKGNIHHITMPAGNITIAISNGNIGQCFLIRILQDATGSRTVTWFSGISWAGGSAPTLTTTASKADSLGFEITGSNTYDGFVIGQNI